MAERQMQRLNAMLAVLTDAEKRSAFDRMRAGVQQSQALWRQWFWVAV